MYRIIMMFDKKKYLVGAAGGIDTLAIYINFDFG